MAKTKVDPLTELADVSHQLGVAESLAEQLRDSRDTLLLEAKESNPDMSLQKLANVAGMRREGVHYAILRAKARRGETHDGH